MLTCLEKSNDNIIDQEYNRREKGKKKGIDGRRRKMSQDMSDISLEIIQNLKVLKIPTWEIIENFMQDKDK